MGSRVFWVAGVVLCLLFTKSSAQYTCSETGPNSCDFTTGDFNTSKNDWCGWVCDPFGICNIENAGERAKDNSIADSRKTGKALAMHAYYSYGYIQSNLACQTHGYYGCLEFTYKFVPGSLEVGNYLGGKTEIVMCPYCTRNTSSIKFSTSWETFRMNVSTREDFHVRITVFNRGFYHGGKLLIRSIRYRQEECPETTTTSSPSTTKTTIHTTKIPIPTTTTNSQEPKSNMHKAAIIGGIGVAVFVAAVVAFVVEVVRIRRSMREDPEYLVLIQ